MRVRILAAAVLVTLLGSAASALAIQPGQHKYLNISLVTGPVWQQIETDSRLQGPGDRWVMGFGLQTGIRWFMADILLTTDRSVDFGLGAFLPFKRFRGLDFVASPFLFYRNGERRVEAIDESKLLREVESTWGAALRAEILMYRKTLGFFIEVRQSVIEPVETSAFAGVSWSPLMLLFLRER